jgi:hypothetical protein
MTNIGKPSMWLAPAAMDSLAVCMGAKPAAQQGDGSESWWPPSLLAEISARRAILLLTFALVLVPQIMSSIVGIKVGTLVSLGIEKPYVVTAGKGVNFTQRLTKYSSSATPWGASDEVYERSLNDAVAAISSLNLGDEAIANLDLANPFPVLFLAPPPKGIQVFFQFDMNLPRDALLEWQDVIGDASVVTIPIQPLLRYDSGRLADIVRPKLATDFKLVYQGALWSIYRRVRLCPDCKSSQIEEVKPDQFLDQFRYDGQILSFATGGNGSNYLRSGWSQTEDWGAWSDGPSATVLLADAALAGKQNVELVIEARGFVSQSQPKQRVRVRVNGADAGELLLDWDITSTSLQVPTEAMRSSVLQIELVPETPMSPATIGTSSDKRLLGVGLKSLQLRDGTT